MFGLGIAPQQSLAVFLLLTTVLGAFFAAGSIASAPPLPGPPRDPYTEPVTICRPPSGAEVSGDQNGHSTTE